MADVDLDLRSEMINSAATLLHADSETVSFSKEVNSYLLKTRNASAYSAKNAALTFWCKHEDDFPHLAAMARVYLDLCISST